MPRMQTLSGLIADAHDAVRFLDSYLEGRHGYTARDVRAGAARLADLRRRIALAAPAGEPGTARALDAAAPAPCGGTRQLGDRG